MALVLADRVQETTAVVSTGTATLLGAVSSFQSFAVIGNGNTTYYCIVDQVGTNWEVGIGTYTSSGTTLSRTTVLASSNAGALVNFTSGTKNVFCTYPAEKSVNLDVSNNVVLTGTITAPELIASNGIVVNNTTISANYTVGTGFNALSVGPISVAAGVVVTVSAGQRYVIF